LRVYVAALAVAVYFALAAWPGLLSGFNHDDLMNMTFALRSGWSKILLGNIAFFSTEYRPLGALFYYTLYETVGLIPLPFRIVGISLLALNLWLAWKLARTLTGSLEAAFCTTLPLVWHGNFGPLFFGSGNIYDVLGFTFYFAALLFHASRRKAGRLSLRALCVLGVLHICALNSKEFTATIPVLILSYELLFQGLRRLDWRAVSVTVVLSGIYTAGKVLGSDSLVSHPAYKPRLSIDAYLASLQSIQNDFLYQTAWASPATAAVFVALMIGLSALLRNKVMLFGAALMLIGPLPVMLIAPRGLAGHYLTIGGFALWFGVLFDECLQRFLRSIRAAAWERSYVSVFALIALFAWHVKTHLPEVQFQQEQFWITARPIEQALASMKKHPEWWSRRDARILFISDPFGDTSQWASAFIANLLSHNPNLPVFNRAQVAASADATFDICLVWGSGEYSQSPCNVKLSALP
jgi:hypothetical protein